MRAIIRKGGQLSHTSPGFGRVLTFGLAIWSSVPLPFDAKTENHPPKPENPRRFRLGDQLDHFALDPPAQLGAETAVGGSGRVDRHPVPVAVEDAGVDVGGAADGGGVAERLGDLV